MGEQLGKLRRERSAGESSVAKMEHGL